MTAARSAWASLSESQAKALAEQHGTPFYFYDRDVLQARAHVATQTLPGDVLYAIKANPHPDVLAALHGRVSGLDVASLGELEQALRSGWSGRQLSFAGPGKSEKSLVLAVAHGVTVSVESLRELELVASLARDAGRRITIRLRVNPEVPAKAYRVSMMGVPSPFGIDEESLDLALERLVAHEDLLHLDGLHVHPGSQCTSAAGVGAVTGIAWSIVRKVETRLGRSLRTLNIGGGFGVVGPDQELSLTAVAEKLERVRRESGSPDVRLIFELGRWLVGPAGLYVTRVVSEKVSRGTHFLVLDGGLNHFASLAEHVLPPGAPRPRLFNLTRPDAAVVTRTLVGPLCTPLDSWGEHELPEPQVGDLVAVEGAGAYGLTFSPSRFLGHPQPVEVISAIDAAQ